MLMYVSHTAGTGQPDPESDVVRAVLATGTTVLALTSSHLQQYERGIHRKEWDMIGTMVEEWYARQPLSPEERASLSIRHVDVAWVGNDSAIILSVASQPFPHLILHQINGILGGEGNVPRLLTDIR